MTSPTIVVIFSSTNLLNSPRVLFRTNSAYYFEYGKEKRLVWDLSFGSLYVIPTFIQSSNKLWIYYNTIMA